MNKEVFAIITVLVFAGLVLWLAPLVSIWSLNTLFGLSIGYGLKQWAAMMWVGFVLFPKSKLIKEK